MAKTKRPTGEELFAECYRLSNEINPTLVASMFKETIKVTHNDGSEFKFKYALALVTQKNSYQFLVVQTEHNGAFVFFMDDVTWSKEKK